MSEENRDLNERVRQQRLDTEQERDVHAQVRIRLKHMWKICTKNLLNMLQNRLSYFNKFSYSTHSLSELFSDLW